MQETGAGGLLGVVDAVTFGGAVDDGGGGGVVDVGGGVDGGTLLVVLGGGIEDEVLVAGVVACAVDDALVEVGGEVVGDTSVEDGGGVVGETSVEVGEVAIEEAGSELGGEACIMDDDTLAGVEGEATVDEPLADTKGIIGDEPVGKELEFTGGLAEVAKVVGVAPVASGIAGLGADTAVAVPSLTGTFRI